MKKRKTKKPKMSLALKKIFLNTRRLKKFSQVVLLSLKVMINLYQGVLWNSPKMKLQELTTTLRT